MRSSRSTSRCWVRPDRSRRRTCLGRFGWPDRSSCRNRGNKYALAQTIIVRWHTVGCMRPLASPLLCTRGACTLRECDHCTLCRPTRTCHSRNYPWCARILVYNSHTTSRKPHGTHRQCKAPCRLHTMWNRLRRNCRRSSRIRCDTARFGRRMHPARNFVDSQTSKQTDWGFRPFRGYWQSAARTCSPSPVRRSPADQSTTLARHQATWIRDWVSQ
jgi:hypothetical protein